MRQSTKHEFYFDHEVLNVHYFEWCNSIHIDDAQDNSVEVHGVTRQHLITLARNAFCCKDCIQPEHITEPHQWSQVEELHAALGKLLASKDSD